MLLIVLFCLPFLCPVSVAALTRTTLSHIIVLLAFNDDGSRSTQENLILSQIRLWEFSPPCTSSHPEPHYPFKQIYATSLIFHIASTTANVTALQELKSSILATLRSLPSHVYAYCFQPKPRFFIDNIADPSLLVEQWVNREALENSKLIKESPEIVFFYFAAHTFPLQERWMNELVKAAKTMSSSSSILISAFSPTSPSSFLSYSASFLSALYNLAGWPLAGSNGNGLITPTQALQTHFKPANALASRPFDGGIADAKINFLLQLKSQGAFINSGMNHNDVVDIIADSEFRDRFALRWLKMHLISYGESEIGQNWTAAESFPCTHSWMHVHCNNHSSQRVTKLDLRRFRLIGSIPSHLAMLDKIDMIFLQENRLSGTIPMALAGLSGKIQVTCNNLMGPSPFLADRQSTSNTQCDACPLGSKPRSAHTAVHAGVDVPTQCDGSYSGRLAWPQARLTHVIMPFVGFQFKRLRRNINSWQKYLPCLPGYNASGGTASASASKPVFILYMSGKYDGDQVYRLQMLWNALPSDIRGCFAAMEVQYANLFIYEDSYLDGSRYMFERMLKRQIRLRDPFYIMYMETDCLPIRSNWLSALDRAARYPVSPFWMKGSIYYGLENATLKEKEDCTGPLVAMKQHINGNSIYNLADPDFVKFYFYGVRAYAKYELNRAYDLDIGSYTNAVSNYKSYLRHSSKILAADFVINYWKTNYSLSYVLTHNEFAYFVHGGTQTK